MYPHAPYKEGPTIQAPQMNLLATSYRVSGATTAVTAAIVDSPYNQHACQLITLTGIMCVLSVTGGQFRRVPSR